MLLLKVVNDVEKDGGEISGRNRIEKLSDLMVARDWLDAEEGLRVIVSLTVVELAWIL